MQKQLKSIIGVVLVTAIGIVIGIAKPWIPELSEQGHSVIMVLLIAIGLWVFKPFQLPFSMGAVFLTGSLLILGIPFSQAFAGFTSAAVWTLIPSLFFGYVVAKTGLGKRIALLLLKQFKPTIFGMTLTFLLIGLVLSMLTPAIVVRISIMLPIAISCLEVCKIKGDSPTGSLVLLTVWATALMPGNAWLTGSLWGPILQGMYDAVPELSGVVNFNSWLQAAFVPLVIQSVILLFGGFLFLRPKEKVDISITKEDFAKQYKELGRMTSPEIYSALILVLSFIVFLLGGLGLHSIPESAVVLVATFLLALTGVIKVNEISTGINWDLVIFVGTALGLGAVFAGTGISEWISSILLELLAPIGDNYWILFFSILLILFLWRFFDIALMLPTLSIFIPTLPAISQRFGINPLVWIPIFVMASNCFFMSYTNVFALFGQSVNGSRGWTQSQISRYGIVYGIACIITLALSIPYWSSIKFLF